MYSISRRTTSSKSRMSFRPLTCHRPVDSRLDADPLSVLVLVPGDLLRRRRTVPTRLISAQQHVPELRQFVQAHPSEKLPDPGDAWIVLILKMAPFIFVQGINSLFRRSASRYMDRNFQHVNSRPFSPTRTDGRRGGPGEIQPDSPRR